MARKGGQIVARGASTWLVRVYLGRDPQTRKYHNHTIHSPFREAHGFKVDLGALRKAVFS
jgi:hypothetical protein